MAFEDEECSSSYIQFLQNYANCEGENLNNIKGAAANFFERKAVSGNDNTAPDN